MGMWQLYILALVAIVFLGVTTFIDHRGNKKREIPDQKIAREHPSLYGKLLAVERGDLICTTNGPFKVGSKHTEQGFLLKNTANKWVIMTTEELFLLKPTVIKKNEPAYAKENRCFPFFKE